MALPAAVGRERRAETRGAALAFQRSDERGFLAADEGAGALLDDDLQLAPADDVELVFADLPDGDFEVADRHRIFGAAVDEQLGRAGGVGGDQHAFEHLVRNRFHQRAVHERARVALVGVADQDLLRCVFGGEEAPLGSGREAAAAASAQAGELHFVHHFGGSHGKRAFEPVIAAVGGVVLETGGVDFPGQRQNFDEFAGFAGGRNFEPVFLAEREDVVDVAFVGPDVAVKDRFAVSEHDFDHRFGIAVSEAAGAFDREGFRTGTQQVEHLVGSGGDAAACDADPDLLDFRLNHLFSYSFRILTMPLRSSLP
ncbi:hypothetical protein SDC9_144412 [bioreactor metagenome]|uniref:Uncharacterized protein n=1 Tax=bioreactor metagenome TaxID=1076179 RepID=A0A645E6S5_9ZZZZ